MPTLNYSLSRAKAELAKSNYPKGFAFKLLVDSGNSQYVAAATIIQQELAAAQHQGDDPTRGQRDLHLAVRGL